MAINVISLFCNCWKKIHQSFSFCFIRIFVLVICKYWEYSCFGYVLTTMDVATSGITSIFFLFFSHETD